MKNKSLATIVAIVLVIAVNIGCDQATKRYAKKTLIEKGTVRVVGDYFILHYAENDGAFLSMFSGLPRAARMVLLLIIPTIAIAWLGVWIVRNNLGGFYLFSLSCFIGGSVSNLYDRFTNRGFVIDFMNMGIGDLRTGIFNFADLSIMFGAVALLILSLKMKKNTPAQQE